MQDAFCGPLLPVLPARRREEGVTILTWAGNEAREGQAGVVSRRPLVAVLRVLVCAGGGLHSGSAFAETLTHLRTREPVPRKDTER